jgi:hypothetical protein
MRAFLTWQKHMSHDQNMNVRITSMLQPSCRREFQHVVILSIVSACVEEQPPSAAAAMSERKRKLEVDEAPSKKVQSAPDPTGGINPYTGRPYSSRYYEILEKRKGGPALRLRLPPVLKYVARSPVGSANQATGRTSKSQQSKQQQQQNSSSSGSSSRATSQGTFLASHIEHA